MPNADCSNQAVLKYENLDERQTDRRQWLPCCHVAMKVPRVR